jgi:predicted secreted protein
MTTYGLGISFLVKKETSTPGVYATIAAAKTNDMTVGNAAIDVSNKDGQGWRTLIGGGMLSIDLSCDGIFTDGSTLADVLALSLSPSPIANYELVDTLGNKFQGPFHLGGITMKGDNFKEQTYSFKLQSSDLITFTPHA